MIDPRSAVYSFNGQAHLRTEFGGAPGNHIAGSMLSNEREWRAREIPAVWSIDSKRIHPLKLPPEASCGVATLIAGSRSIIGTAGFKDGTTQIVLWQNPEALPDMLHTALESLVPEVAACNQDGAAVGSAIEQKDKRQRHPLLWSPNAPHPTNLTLPPGFTNGEACSINNFGWICGSVSSGGVPMPCIWSEPRAPSVLPVDATKYEGGETLSISDYGDVLGVLTTHGNVKVLVAWKLGATTRKPFSIAVEEPVVLPLTLSDASEPEIFVEATPRLQLWLKHNSDPENETMGHLTKPENNWNEATFSLPGVKSSLREILEADYQVSDVQADCFVVAFTRNGNPQTAIVRHAQSF